MAQKIKKEDFKCFNCSQWVFFTENMGTDYRNHCPFCLYSKHLDFKKSGDRKSKCQEKMKPIGLTFKHEGKDKYNKLKQGELMLIHECLGCKKISINRIAADDREEEILKIFKKSQNLSSNKINKLKQEGVVIVGKEEKEKIFTQLFGKVH